MRGLSLQDFLELTRLLNYIVHGNRSEVYFSSLHGVGIIVIVLKSQSGLPLYLFQHIIIVQCTAINSCAGLSVAQCNLVIKWHCLCFFVG